MICRFYSTNFTDLFQSIYGQCTKPPGLRYCHCDENLFAVLRSLAVRSLLHSHIRVVSSLSLSSVASFIADDRSTSIKLAFSFTKTVESAERVKSFIEFYRDCLVQCYEREYGEHIQYYTDSHLRIIASLYVHERLLCEHEE